MHIWRLPSCYEVLCLQRTYSLLLNMHCHNRLGTQPFARSLKGVHTWVYLFLCACVSECIVSVCVLPAVTVRLWYRCCVQHLCLCLTFLDDNVLAEEQRRLCKCLPYENLGKMWLERNKLKTSGQRPNICCLEGEGWSEQCHMGNSEGKGRGKAGQKKMRKNHWCF